MTLEQFTDKKEIARKLITTVHVLEEYYTLDNDYEIEMDEILKAQDVIRGIHELMGKVNMLEGIEEFL